jgi:hypothetical protein
VAHDDSLDAEPDGLLNLLALQRGVLLALENMQVNAQSLRLVRDSRFIGLEIVALREIADERNLDAALVERRRRALDAVGKCSASNCGRDEKAD